MNSTAPHGLRKPEKDLLTKREFASLLARAAKGRQLRRRADKWHAYESLKRQLDGICGWSCRDPHMSQEHWDAAIRMLTKAIGI